MTGVPPAAGPPHGPAGRSTSSIAVSTSCARTVPSSRPSSSTMTPRRLGEDSAASRALRSGPETVATVPPRCTIWGCRSRSIRDGSTQPSGRSSSVTSTQPSAVAWRTCSGVAPICTVGSCRIGSSGGGLEAERAVAAVAADEVGDEVVDRVGQQVGGGGELGERAADPQHGDLVAELDRLVDVVGDEEDGLAELLLQPQELVLQLLAHDRVDRAERLVHQHHRRVGGQRAGHADALLLAAGELGGVAAGEAGRQADPLEQLHRPGAGRGLASRRAAAARSRRCRRSCGAGRARRAG